MTAAERFTFRFGHAYRRPARLFGITPETAWVDIGEDTLRTRLSALRKRLSSPPRVTMSLPRWSSCTALLPSTAAIWDDRASLEKRGLFGGRCLDALAAA